MIDVISSWEGGSWLIPLYMAFYYLNLEAHFFLGYILFLFSLLKIYRHCSKGLTYKKKFYYHVLKIDTIITPSSQVGLAVKNLSANAEDIKRCGFNSWVSKIPWRRAWQRTPVSLPGKISWTEDPCVLQSTGLPELDMTEESQHTCMYYNSILQIKYVGNRKVGDCPWFVWWVRTKSR